MGYLNLPHKYPLNFAKKVLNSTATIKNILCEFETLPTISMLLEAGAQSTAAFGKDSNQTQGMLIKAENIELLQPISSHIYTYQIQILSNINNWTKYSFEVLYESQKVCKGTILISTN